MPISLFIVSIRARLSSVSVAVAGFGKVEVDGEVDGEGMDENDRSGGDGNGLTVAGDELSCDDTNTRDAGSPRLILV